jgi:hypothetical protein
MKKHLFFISIILFSCQEEITLELPQAETKLVVQGAIENGFPPYVVLTRNQGYFEEINSDTYANLFVDDVDSVKVWYIDDNGEEISKHLGLLPPELSEIITGEPMPLYTITDAVELENAIINPGEYNFSQSGRTYYLEIKWNNKVITSSTTIPLATALDCLWVEQSETADEDFMYDIRAIYSDPAEQNNNLIIKSKRLQHYEINREDTSSCETINYPDFSLKLIDAGSDILINGQTFETYFPRPKDSGNPFPDGNYNSYHTKICDNDTLEFKEDIVLIKFCQIDEPSLKFWRGLVRQAGNNGNPFAEPMNLVSNINNGLGVFTGYGSVYYKLPIINDTTIFEEYSTEIIDIF